MSADTNAMLADGQVLRAAEVPTEVQLADTHPPGPAYVDVSDGASARKPVIPAHLRDGGGLYGLARGIRRQFHRRAIRHGHAAAYHGIRSPRYLTLTLAWAIVGLFRTLGRIIAWWHATDLYQLEHQAAADGLLTEHLRIHKRAGRPAPRGGTILRGVRRARGGRGLLASRTCTGRCGPRSAWSRCRSWPGTAARAGKAIVTSADLPAAVQAPPGRHHPSARQPGHRGDRPVAARRPPARVPVAGPRGRPRVAGRGRPAVRRAPRRRSSSGASSSPPGCAARSARCGPSRSRTSTPGGWSCGSAARTSPRRSRRRGRCCGPGRPTSSAASRSAPTCAAAASRCR